MRHRIRKLANQLPCNLGWHLAADRLKRLWFGRFLAIVQAKIHNAVGRITVEVMVVNM